jgi:hypothetical protein
MLMHNNPAGYTADFDPAHLRCIVLAAREPHRNRLDQINRSLELTSTANHKISFAECAPETNPGAQWRGLFLRRRLHDRAAGGS